MTRLDALRAVVGRLRDDVLVVACNGMISRELYTLGDQPNRFYMLGSMGLASTIGLGLALRRPERTVVVLDGDGNVLMNMGALGNVGQAGPANFYHLVLDNGVHASTGGQLYELLAGHDRFVADLESDERCVARHRRDQRLAHAALRHSSRRMG